MDGGNPLVAVITAQLLLTINYICGVHGYQKGMPEVHDSAEKRQFLSSVEVFDVNKYWNKYSHT